MQNSGKLLILGILTVALLLAGTAWWFRYQTTHRAANFWGPQAVHLIRDAPVVELCQFKLVEPKEPHYSALQPRFTDCRNISALPGITHLRNALLEDRSFRWPASPIRPGIEWKWVIIFRDESNGKEIDLYFSSDWTFVRGVDDTVLSAQPIADGLATMLDELVREPANSR